MNHRLYYDSVSSPSEELMHTSSVFHTQVKYKQLGYPKNSCRVDIFRGLHALASSSSIELDSKGARPRRDEISAIKIGMAILRIRALGESL